ncbi:hypothetical protein, partial [Staphylococcus aureus]
SILVTAYMDISGLTSIPYPGDIQNSVWKSTHFDSHSIHDNLLLLNIGSHDDSTMSLLLIDSSIIDSAT